MTVNGVATGTDASASAGEVFEARYAINSPRPLTEGDITGCLRAIKLPMEFVEVNATKKTVDVKSGVAPSVIVRAFQSAGLDAILRGSGEPNSSGVAILETFDTVSGSEVEGLVRMVQVGDKKTMFDVTVNGVEHPGQYSVAVHECGDVSRGLQSTGRVLHQFDGTVDCHLNSADSPGKFSGQAFLSAPLQPWEVIGRSIIVSRDGQAAIGGVVARSAGVWENDKRVCACTGKTIWEERKEARDRNIN
ncbi:copper chaperone CCS1 KNAG_0M02320 [Huiozyma naganishii CBS 8797]|uniref:Superoxide dismutase 1 copper chaperone n=1 Tax=Huiozyma naganishii (strain ATCC MYA-139 / BCRC 22969 / CBS 8797 / KCTC 17520 / NBRC 10181 / NCYC 3082 / Yp74L-3) TaxID=1071383 RepID=J7RE17_HUIN7|nr:hypothetical protein KNAG_0M02320 [Kazachstania naganishii CBS 8797]CCK73085.1 hypothetical protein KNAG_0M02320 [Kazachstania naganishii CBS 8797]